MKTMITIFFTLFTVTAFSQIKVNGVELPENINIIEARIMEYKSLCEYVILIDYGQEDVWAVGHYLLTDGNGSRKTFNGWVQAINYLDQNGFELLGYVEHETRLPEVDAAIDVTFILRRKP